MPSARVTCTSLDRCTPTSSSPRAAAKARSGPLGQRALARGSEAVVASDTMRWALRLGPTQGLPDFAGCPPLKDRHYVPFVSTPICAKLPARTVRIPGAVQIPGQGALRASSDQLPRSASQNSNPHPSSASSRDPGPQHVTHESGDSLFLSTGSTEVASY